MSDFTDIDRARYGAVTFADPVSETPLADIVRTAERSARLTGNIVSESAAREEAYDNRIRAIRTATGIELENPERGGYSRDARHAIRQEVIAGGMSPIDETGGIPAYQKRIFDQKVAELQVKHPDLTDAITGSVGEEARKLAAGSSQDLARAMDQPGNPILKLGAEFAGGMWGSRRDPLFIGSLFAGPATATGKTAFAMVAKTALNQGLFNAGITAMEQPNVQAWHAKIGQDTGVAPFMHEVGMAFVTGAIGGAVIGGGVEGLKAAATPLRRLLKGSPEPGDVAKASEHLGPVEPSAAAAMRAGEDSLAADHAVLTEAPPKDVPPELHDDLMGAALKRADDPAAASPEAVAAVRKPTEPMVSDRTELETRIQQAAPQTEREAMAVADEALDDFGRRDGMAELAERMRAAREAQDETTEAWRNDATREQPGAEHIRSMVPMLDRNNNVVMRSERAVRSDGDVEQATADLIRSCK